MYKILVFKLSPKDKQKILDSGGDPSLPPLELALAHPDIEIWLNCPNAPGYKVSSWGRVKSKYRPSINKRGSLTIRKGSLIKPSEHRDGYLFVRVSQGSGPIKHYVHRLVAHAFFGPPEEDIEVDHIDRNRTNNVVSNLRYATKAENSDNRVLNPNRGEDCHFSKVGQGDIDRIRALYKSEKFNQTEIADLYGLDKSTVSRIVRGESWKK